jgi:hypothetical protein
MENYIEIYSENFREKEHLRDLEEEEEKSEVNGRRVL